MAHAEREDQLERALRARVYRMSCPPPERIGEWRLGLGEPDPELLTHLQSCPHCTRELAWLDRLLALGVSEPAPKRLLTLLPLPPVQPPAFALRGEARLQEAAYGTERYTVSIGIEPDPSDPDRRMVLGVVGGEAERPAGEAVLASDQESFTSPVDEAGQFAFPGVPRGRYGLWIRLQDVELHVTSLEIT